MSGIKIDERFPSLQLGRKSYGAKNDTDAKLQALENNMNALNNHVNMMATRLNSALRTIEQSYKAGTATTINTILSGGGGGGGSAQTIQIYCKTEQLQANVTKSIVFASPFSVPFAITSVRLFNDVNAYITDFTISNITATGFNIVCPEDATFICLVANET